MENLRQDLEILYKLQSYDTKIDNLKKTNTTSFIKY